MSSFYFEMEWTVNRDHHHKKNYQKTYLIFIIIIDSRYTYVIMDAYHFVFI